MNECPYGRSQKTCNPARLCRRCRVRNLKGHLKESTEENSLLKKAVKYFIHTRNNVNNVAEARAFEVLAKLVNDDGEFELDYGEAIKELEAALKKRSG